MDKWQEACSCQSCASFDRSSPSGLLVVIQCSEPSCPASGGMKETQYFHCLVPYTIGDDVRSAVDHQFSGSDDPSRSAQERKAAELFHREINGYFDPGRRRRRIVAGYIFRFRLQIGDGGAQPPNAHATSTS